jgi:hypothetical protein
MVQEEKKNININKQTNKHKTKNKKQKTKNKKEHNCNKFNKKPLTRGQELMG